MPMLFVMCASFHSFCDAICKLIIGSRDMDHTNILGGEHVYIIKNPLFKPRGTLAMVRKPFNRQTRIRSYDTVSHICSLAHCESQVDSPYLPFLCRLEVASCPFSINTPPWGSESRSPTYSSLPSKQHPHLSSGSPVGGLAIESSSRFWAPDGGHVEGPFGCLRGLVEFCKQYKLGSSPYLQKSFYS